MAGRARTSCYWILRRSEERRVGKECRSRCDWSSDVCSSDLFMTLSSNLSIGSKGDDVIILQNFLINQAAGPSASALASVGATGRFGPITKAALAEWQAAHGLPATGFFGDRKSVV